RAHGPHRVDRDHRAAAAVAVPDQPADAGGVLAGGGGHGAALPAERRPLLPQTAGLGRDPTLSGSEEVERRDRYHESGASGWALAGGPLCGLVGYVGGRRAGGRGNTTLWLWVGVGLFALPALWVCARRRFLSARVTDTELWQGGERLAVDRITAVD